MLLVDAGRDQAPGAQAPSGAFILGPGAGLGPAGAGGSGVFAPPVTFEARVSALVTFFAPQPLPEAWPQVFPHPLDEVPPHGLAVHAANVLQAKLRLGFIAPALSTTVLEGPRGGKMFGVLVVATPEGQVGFLAGFSGMLAGRWEVEGYVPPLFDQAARRAVEPAGEAVVKRLWAEAERLAAAPERLEHARRLERFEARAESWRGRLRQWQLANRAERQRERARLQNTEEAERAVVLARLGQQSRADAARRKRLEAALAAARKKIQTQSVRLERRLRALERLRWLVCGRLMQQLHATYEVPAADGTSRGLRALFAPAEPPSGAGDCAAPKLLAFAHRQGLRPLALAEFWWGPPPPTGGRVAGAFYPACKRKCGPLLPVLLAGLPVSEPRRFAPPDRRRVPLEVVFEDDWLAVVAKPAGLLSVPGRDATVTDSVLARARVRWPSASGPLIVHRLDMDTSGLVVIPKNQQAHAELQRQFLARTVKKRYVAWLEGTVAGTSGEESFPLRVDLEDRPRQIFDPLLGKKAVTRWQVLERRIRRTRVGFFPETGRTHQIRVHAAHPLGLGAPIVGDRLYGHPGPRLLLHADRLAFFHPHTGAEVVFESPAPF